MNFVIQKKPYKEPVLFTLDNKRMVFGECNQSGSGDADCTQVGQSAAALCFHGISTEGTCGDGLTAAFDCYYYGTDFPK